MSPALAPSALRTVSLPVAFLAALRRAAHASADPAMALDAVRDAGFAAGEALFAQFADWLIDQGEDTVDDLADARFPLLFTAFFHHLGWGRLELAPLSDAVLAIDAYDWAETSDAPGGCLLTTGMLSGFLGGLAGAPLAVLEVDAAATSAGHSRFLVGSVDVLDYVWDAMARGIPYERAAFSA
jgi:hypothetical protein